MKILVDGEPVEVPAGTTVAAALAIAGVRVFRTSVSGQARGPVCGMGICFECRVTIDGRAHERSCQTLCRERMEIGTVGRPFGAAGRASARPKPGGSLACDVVIIGAGPAGLAAARRARESGASVALVDDNPAPGGQVWRGERMALPDGCKVLCGAQVVAAPAPGRITIETGYSAFDLGYGFLILATGARERFLPFPGWTLPHVTGAGGLQALVKSGMAIVGKRVVVAGSGPLLLAVAHYLRQRGAEVALVAEQADGTAVRRFGLSLARHPGKLAQAARLLMGIRYLTGCWPIAAVPGAVELRCGSRAWTERCDYLACGFGLMPNAELPMLLGCGTEVDEWQQTRMAGVYAAGEVTGIGGLELSRVEGEIAGHAAAGNRDRARRLFRARERHRRFAAEMERAFALREELMDLAQEETIVCRCEDVAWGRVRGFTGWREAKLHTRCGMGACQGRVCGGALEFLKGWKGESARPPVFPARIETLL